MKKIIISLILVLTILSSCSYYAYSFQTGAYPKAETIPEMIKLYSGDIEQDYDIIGPIAVDVMGGGEKAARYIKKQASKLGADAVIEAELTKMNSFSSRTGISGISIKIK